MFARIGCVVIYGLWCVCVCVGTVCEEGGRGKDATAVGRRGVGACGGQVAGASMMSDVVV